MAGKRQHYVPRLLQRGFVADPTDEGERTWLHRRGASPKLVGIRHIGVEDWFYSRKSSDGAPTLDDAITEYERDLSKNVNALRSAASGTIIPSQQAAETIVHLVLRTAHLRNVMSSGVSRLTGEIAALFTDPVRLGRMIGLASPILGEATEQAIQKKAAELAAAGFPPPFSERLMAFLLRELGDQLVMNAATALAPLMSEIFGDIEAKVRDAHNAMLAKPAADKGWIVELSRFEWEVKSAEDVILPDAVALSRATGEQLAPFLFTSGAEAELVVMPLAPGRILIGRRGNAIFDSARFNEDAAAASESFFISARPMRDGSLSELIGTGPAAALECRSAMRSAKRSTLANSQAAISPQCSRKNVSSKISVSQFG